ncbi:carbon-nitrogen hydrolase family protein [Desulfosoma caldarium]|uniref:Putative amidohydrolase n=1 Tax=Desulfosoma caldarium TaxID=610254 RepID=A0A3N1UU94_9BACT|nr:carbon-nitrogen hydrolase family protein [Desulfosoma caldarium]ROQ93288.1 putative amidohydrolase [Desulfosoma caldarium]
MKDTIRVALVQPKPYAEFDDPRNIAHGLHLLERIRGHELDMVCFPEYFPFAGEEVLAEAARDLRSYIVAGLVEQDGGRLYNTATLFDRSGRLLGRQRKANVGALERDHLHITAGDGVFRAFSVDFGKIGLPVCIDFWGQPDAATQLANQGVEIVFNISIFPILRGHWKTGALVRAFDNFFAVVGVNTADYNAMIGGRRYHQHGGGSFVLQPPRFLDKAAFRRWFRSLDTLDDWVTLELDALEQVHVAEVHLGSVRRYRREFWNRFGFQRV